MHEDWNDLPRLPEEPRRLRGDAGAGRSRPDTADATTPPRPTCSSSTPARSSTRPSRNRSTPFSRWPSTRSDGACRRLVVTGCLAERYRDELGGDSRDRRRPRHRRSARHRRRDRRPARDRRRCRSARRARRSPRPAHVRTLGTAKPPTVIDVGAGFATPSSDISLRRRHSPAPGDAAATTPTSRSPKAATTRAPSASSRRCAAITAAAPPTSIVREATSSPPAASRNCC